MSLTPFHVIVTKRARHDMQEALDWSLNEFGQSAKDRYQSLLLQAMNDLGDNPLRGATRQREDLPADIFLYPISASRERVYGERVGRPRHVMVFRIQNRTLRVVRVLHESQDLAQHLGGVE